MPGCCIGVGHSFDEMCHFYCLSIVNARDGAAARFSRDKISALGVLSGDPEEGRAGTAMATRSSEDCYAKSGS